MTDHVVSVGPVRRDGQVVGSTTPPAYAYRCTCGATGKPHAAVSTATAKRREARELAEADALQHQREARRRAGVDRTGLPPAA